MRLPRRVIATCGKWAAAQIFARRVNFAVALSATCAARPMLPAFARPFLKLARGNMILFAAATDRPIAMNASPIPKVSAPPMRASVSHKSNYPLNVN